MEAMATVVDPRGANCRGFELDGNGKVSGIQLVFVEKPATKYRLVRVNMLDEASAAGNTVATFSVLDGEGIEAAEKVYLAWPFPDCNNRALPGNPNRQHMIMNGFNPPNIGPLAIYVGDDQGNPISDIIGGLGLPLKRHVSFTMVFKERAAAPDPDPDPDPGGGGGGDDTGGTDLAAVIEELKAINTTLKAAFRLS